MVFFIVSLFKLLIVYVESFFLLLLLYKKSGDCFFKCIIEEEVGVYLAGGIGYCIFGILLLLVFNLEVVIFCRGGNYFVVRII